MFTEKEFMKEKSSLISNIVKWVICSFSLKNAARSFLFFIAIVICIFTDSREFSRARILIF